MGGKIYQWNDFARNRRIRTQVCVIGTGCGGSTLALHLAHSGIDVALIEQGGYYPTGAFDNHELNMAGMISADRNLGTDTDGSISLTYGNNVGGASVHYWADSYRTPPDRLQLWAERYGIENHSLNDLNPHWDVLERDLHVHAATEPFFNRMNQLVRTAAGKLRWSGHRVPQARHNCQRSGHCMQGCAFNAKQSQLITHIPRAISLGASVYADCRAREFILEGDRVRALRARMIDRPSQRENGVELTFEADVFVVAAGGFGSSTLLLRNGWKQRLPALGEHVAINPSVFIHALYPEDIIQWRNIPAAFGVDEFRLARFDTDGNYSNGGYLLMPNQLQPAALAALLPGFGRQHRDWMQQMPRMGGTIAWIDDVDGELGRITIDGDRRRVEYGFGNITKQIIRDNLKKQALLNFTAGATEVIVPDARATV
ncbi:MAG: FAD-dependent oxidoreductase, partial [Leptospiraceae bacterium]|nr:FAD-dependent oxidoreductase [Leptospiraceae bacterium]